jgi:hypothetical protein
VWLLILGYLACCLFLLCPTAATGEAFAGERLIPIPHFRGMEESIEE